MPCGELMITHPHHLPHPPPPPQQQQHQHHNTPTITRPVPCGELMRPREVLYVVQQQLRQLETADPFTADHYYIMVLIQPTDSSPPRPQATQILY